MCNKGPLNACGRDKHGHHAMRLHEIMEATVTERALSLMVGLVPRVSFTGYRAAYAHWSREKIRNAFMLVYDRIDVDRENRCEPMLWHPPSLQHSWRRQQQPAPTPIAATAGGVAA